MVLNREQKSKIASESVDMILDMGVALAIVNIDGYGDDDESKDHVKTLILALIGEDEKFKLTFITKGVDIIRRAAKTNNLKPFQWDTQAQLEHKQQVEMKAFSEYLGKKIVQYIKFPDKKSRDKLNKALSHDKKDTYEMDV